MKLVTALFDSRDYGVMVRNLKRSCIKIGYDLVVYSLTSDPMTRFDNKNSYFVPCNFKPKVILQALHELNEDIVWVDSDCLINKRIDEILDNCDVCVTLRRWASNSPRPIYNGYINAGVMAFRNFTGTECMVEKWIKKLPESQSDQDAMNRLLLQDSALVTYNEVIDIGCAKVKVESCEKYNYWYVREGKTDASIFHIKGEDRALCYNRYAQFVLGKDAELIK